MGKMYQRFYTYQMILKYLIPKPILIEISNETILVREIDGKKIEGQFHFPYIKRPSGKIICAQNKNSDLIHTAFSFTKEYENQDIFALKKLIKKVRSARYSIIKSVFIWNFRNVPTLDLITQVRHLSSQCDAREILIIGEKNSLENDPFPVNQMLEYKFLGDSKIITNGTKSLITLVAIIGISITLLYWRISL